MRAPKVPPKELRRVVIAASVGNIIEWYDFYIFGSLAAILAVKFFQKGHPVAAFLSTVAIFSVGFLIRPLGAFVFGWLGDKVGRKYTFIVTLTGMGIATALIGFVPSYTSIGLAAAFILFVLRLIQGLCLGGEYGGAITYVAEHIEDEHRGYYTGWLQTSPTLGIVVSLATIIGIRTYLGIEAFNDWGWRLPFIISLLLVAIAIWIRLSLGETPIFQDIKARGRTTTNPWREAFLSIELQVRGDRQRGRAGTGMRLVQRPVLGALLPPDGQEARRADLQHHRRHRAADRHAHADLLGLALGQGRPQADHTRWHGPGVPHVLPALHGAWHLRRAQPTSTTRCRFSSS